MSAAVKVWLTAAVLVIWGASFGQWLDDYDTAKRTAETVEDIGQAQRFARGAQAMCGENAAWEDLGGGVVQCFTHKSHKTMVASIK